jgi:hypothetical protein
MAEALFLIGIGVAFVLGTMYGRHSERADEAERVYYRQQRERRGADPTTEFELGRLRRGVIAHRGHSAGRRSTEGERID